MFKYDALISADNSTSQGKVINYVNHKDVVLEFGCSNGQTSAFLKEQKQCRVYGIETDSEAYSKASKYLSGGKCCDIEVLSWVNDFSDIKFDAIIFADVLEHLRNPSEVLNAAVKLLKEDGKVIVSIPNICHVDILAKMLCNRFDYSSTGILDDTHVHFWGSENIKKLCSDSGLFLSELDGTVAPSETTEQHFEEIDKRIVDSLSSKSFGDIYQFVFLAYKSEYAERNHFRFRSKIGENNTAFKSFFDKDDVNLAKIYFDCGYGFDEKKALTIQYNGSHFEALKLDVPNNCRVVRFDPVDDKFAIISDLVISTDRGIVKKIESNSDYDAYNTFFFENTDCKFQIELRESVNYVSFSCNVFGFDSVYGASYISLLIKEISGLNEEKLQLSLNVKQEKERYNEALALKEKETQALRLEFEEKLSEKDKEKSVLLSEKETALKNETNALLSDKDRRISEISGELEHYKEHYCAAINQREDLKAQLASTQSDYNSRLSYWQTAYNTISNAQFWKMTAPFRKLLDGIKSMLRKNKVTYLIGKGMVSLKQNGFKATWKKVKYKLKPDYRIKEIAKTFVITPDERQKQEQTKFNRDIKFSILVPLYNTPIKFLDEMIGSVTAQTYANWELCLADGSDKNHNNVGKEVKKLAQKDKRIKYKKLKQNLGISENTNACIEISTGDYIALFDHDDILHPSALFEVMKAICDKEADFVYTDEATFVSPDINNIVTAHFKPDFAPDNLKANNYICHLSVFSKEVLNKAGRFRSKYDGSQDHDLILRLTANAEKIVHIPKLLYFWRSHPNSTSQDINSKSYAVQAGKNAVIDSIKAEGFNADVESSRAFPTIYRVKYELKCNDLVSIIIPNKNHLQDLKKCIDSIFTKTTYKNYEIIIIDNGSDDEELFVYYEILKKYRCVQIYPLDIEFNYSKLNNFAVSKANGNYYILLNNDIEIITGEWIEEMFMYVQRRDVGAAGAMLYYPDNSIQHAGIIIGLGTDRVAGHAFHRCNKNYVGYMGRLCYAQNMSAVTAACMMVKASVYKEVGGLDEELLVAYNDVDLCMKIRKAGYLIVWTPYAEAYHYESKSRGYDTAPEKQKRFKFEAEYFKEKWKNELERGDPYYNPNLTLDRGDFSLK